MRNERVGKQRGILTLAQNKKTYYMAASGVSLRGAMGGKIKIKIKKQNK